MTAAVRLVVLMVLFVAVVGAGASDVPAAGIRAYERGDLATAETLFREALRRDPRNPVLHYHLGITLTRLARWREAADALQTALGLQPSREVESAARETLRTLRPMLTARQQPSRDSIPLHRAQGVWLVDVLVNGVHQARFLVDTGASISVISPGLAERAGIRPDPDSRPISLVTLSGRTVGHPTTVSSITVGQVEARDIRAVLHPTGDVFEGILGNNFLGRYNAAVDPKRGVLELEAK